MRIPIASSMFRYFGVFRGLVGNRLFVLLLLAFLAGLFESVGLVMFLPLFELVVSNSPEDSIATEVLGMIGVEPTLTMLFVAIPAVFLLKAAVQFVEGAYRGKLIAKLTEDTRTLALSKLSNANYEYFLASSIGEKANLVHTESVRMVGAFNRYSQAILALVSVGTYFAFVIGIDWTISLAAVVFALLIVLVLRPVNAFTKRKSMKNSELNSDLQSFLFQILNAYPFLKATATFPVLLARVQDRITRIASVQFKIELGKSFIKAVSEPLAAMFVLALLGWSFVQADGLTSEKLSGVMISVVFFYKMMQKVMMFQTQWQNFNALTGGLETVRRSLKILDNQREESGSRSVKRVSAVLKIDNVSFAYAGTTNPVLKNVSIHIDKNETVAIVGESGSGKSTLIGLLTGMLKPQEGEISVDGVNLADANLSEWRNMLGYVTQAPVIFNTTIRENISLWDDSADATVRVERSADRALCSGFIQQCAHQYETVIGDHGLTLSGGQKQRLAIARELYRNPQLLILDEATSALDSESEKTLQEGIEQLKGEISMVIIAHRLSTVKFADKIIVLKDGAVAESGSFDELMNTENSVFSHMVKLQELE